MTYVVTDACIKCKYTDCVEVCPVDCFYEGENMLVINPSECIDCGVCEPECPAEAILPDTEDGTEKSTRSTRKNGPISPRRKIRLPMPMSTRARTTSSRSSFLPNRAKATRAIRPERRGLNAVARLKA